MKIDKEVQYGMLICLYLQRAGRVRLDDIADSLEIKDRDFSCAAYWLGEADLINFIPDGDNGGLFELNGDPTVKQVFQAFDALDLVTQSEKDMLSTGCHEFRALGICLRGIKQSMSPVLNRKISNINKELVVSELRQIEKAKDTGWMN